MKKYILINEYPNSPQKLSEFLVDENNIVWNEDNEISVNVSFVDIINYKEFFNEIK